MLITHEMFTITFVILLAVSQEVILAKEFCNNGEIAENLGVQNGKIPDSQLKSSSFWSVELSPQQGRLYGTASWSARVSDQNQWFQVDLGTENNVKTIATQGRHIVDQWVKTYSVSYSLDGQTLEPYTINGVEKIFNGNTDRSTVAFNELSPGVDTRYIRIHPKSWHIHISMRIELFGCPLPGYCKYTFGDVPFGVKFAKYKDVPDRWMTASSFWSAELAPSQGRLNGPASWSARISDQNQWIQVQFDIWKTVKKIATQGRNNVDQWVKTYSMSYNFGDLNLGFTPYKTNGVEKIFNGNTDQSTVVNNVLSPAVDATYIRIHPKSWHIHISMRLEFYGCSDIRLSQCPSQAPDKWARRRGKCYLFVRTSKTFDEARKYCRSKGGELAFPMDESENKFISWLGGQYGLVWPWIGLFRRHDKKFVTECGQIPTYTNWNKGQPDDIKEKCAHMYARRAPSGKWNDWSCNNRNAFVCERITDHCLMKA